MAERIRVSLYQQSPDAFHSLAASFVATLKESIKRANKIAAGELYDSIDYNIEQDDDVLKINILAADQLLWIVEGRRPGKWPPVRNIIEWTKSKGIPESAAWPIAYNIYKFGIKPTPEIFGYTFSILDNQLIKDFGITLSEKIEDTLVKVLEKLNNK